MDEVVNSILDYVRKDHTDYAIMLNGEWGSGKTYFWNNKLRKKIESTDFNGKSYKTIYMSLYGINSLEEISKKIFFETNPYINKTLKKYVETRAGNTIPEYVKTGLDMANLFGVGQFTNDKVDFSKCFSIEDKVLCFDDLERANVDVIDILGYINNFVEHDGIKTILICNEKELSTKLKNSNVEMKTFIATYILDKEGKLGKGSALSEEASDQNKPIIELIEDKIANIFDKANDYERIKEKLIGETFEYVPEFNYILNGLLMRFSQDEDLCIFLRKNSNLIISTFNKTGTRNLRVLKHALNDFEKIYYNINKNYNDIDDQVLKSLLIFTIAISFEIKAGKVTKDRFKDIMSNDEYMSLIFTSKILDDNKQFYLREFDNTYFFNFKTSYRFFKFIEIYVRTRIFDMRTFKVDMDNVLNKVTVALEPSYKKILNGDYWKLPDNDFNKLVYETLEEIKLGRLQLHEYLNAFIVFNYFVDKQLLEYDKNVLRQIFITGMNVSMVHAQYYKNEEEILNDFDSNDIDNADFEEIKNTFIKLNIELREKYNIEKVNELFEYMPDKMDIFYKQFSEEFKDIAVFKHYDPYILFDRILTLNNYDLTTFTNAIENRYNTSRDMLKEDTKNIKLLRQIIDDYVRNKVVTIKIVLLKELSETISSIIGAKRGRKKLELID